MNLANIAAQLQLHTAQFTRALNGARRQVQNFSSYVAQASAANEGMATRMVQGYTSLNDRLRQVGFSLRDITRISAGIVISQTFYGVTRSIREATDAVWEFNKSLDYAQVTYSALFNSTDIASDFLETLKEFSVDTIFEYSDLENMSRKLLAYGIEYKNLMFLIEGLTNIGTLSGDSAALERLAVAIGQINAKGTLKAEEIRQLTNAYAPMYDILQSEFGLQPEQLNRIGDLQLPANEVINAIVKYANERFGDVANAAMYTITGLNNRIVDSFKVLASDMMKPFSDFYKSFAFFIGQQLEQLREIFSTSGTVGVFERLVPSEAWRARIVAFTNSLKGLLSAVMGMFQAMSPYLNALLGGLMTGFSIVVGVIGGVVDTLTQIYKTIAGTVPVVNLLTKALFLGATAWAMFKLQGLAAAAIAGVRVAIVACANAVLFLAKAILANPILTFFMLLGVAAVGLSSKLNGANNAFSSIVDAFKNFGSSGTVEDTSDALGGAADNSDQFWESMEEGANSAEDAVNGAGSAAKKAAAGLLSFDEVFKLTQKDTSGGSGSALDNFDMSGLGDALSGIGGGGLIPDIPDFSEYATNFVQSLYSSLWEAIKTISSGAVTGGIIGALVGFTIGGLVTKTMAGALGGAKLGSKIGAIAGAGFAGFWTDTYKEMEASLLKIAGRAASGALVGGLVGMIVGAFATKTLDGALTAARFGASIGGLIGAGLGSFWSVATEEMNNAIEGLLVGGAAGALSGALVGFVLGAFSTKTLQGAVSGAMLGAKIGGVIGGGLGAVFGSVSKELQHQITSIAIGTAEGALIGGLSGFMLGAFVTKTLAGALTGAKYGAGLGALLGGMFKSTFASAEEEISTEMNNLFSSVTAASTGALIGGLAGMLVGAIIGAFAGGIGAIPGAKAGATIGAALGGLGGLIVDYLDTSGIVESLTTWFDKLGATMGAALGTAWVYVSKAGAGILKGIGEWLGNLWTGFSTWFNNLGPAISDWWTNAWDTVSNVWITGWDAVVSWFEGLYTDVSDWFSDRIADIKSWWSNLWSTSLWSTGWSKVSTWFSTLGNSVYAWFTSKITDIKNWWKDLWDTTTWSSGWSKISSWFSTLGSDISSWFTTKITDIKSWWKDLWDTTTWSSGWSKISSWFSTLGSDISSWFTTKVTDIKSWWKDLWDTTTWSSGWSKISSWFSTLFTDISSWFTDLSSSISTWWNNLWKDKKASVNITTNTTSSSSTNKGIAHGGVGGAYSPLEFATGGIVRRDQIVRVAEGNKSEAIIPLENETAMRPFADAVSSGILQSILPSMASVSGGSSSNLPPMYVGTLIADERGLQELYKKFTIYEAKEQARKGLA